MSDNSPLCGMDLLPYGFTRRDAIPEQSELSPSVGSVQETGEIHFLKLEAENMALSLEAVGYGRHCGGKMCTPLERYRAKYPRREAQNDEALPQAGRK